MMVACFKIPAVGLSIASALIPVVGIVASCGLIPVSLMNAFWSALMAVSTLTDALDVFVSET
jgi:Asp/Glu/hydantoin racemase